MKLFDSYTIKAEKQKNGVWGTYLNIVFIDKIVFEPQERTLLRSALWAALAEVFKNEQIKITMSDEKGFMCKKESGPIYIELDRYNIEGHQLTFK